MPVKWRLNSLGCNLAHQHGIEFILQRDQANIRRVAFITRASVRKFYELYLHIKVRGLHTFNAVVLTGLRSGAVARPLGRAFARSDAR